MGIRCERELIGSRACVVVDALGTNPVVQDKDKVIEEQWHEYEKNTDDSAKVTDSQTFITSYTLEDYSNIEDEITAEQECGLSERNIEVISDGYLVQPDGYVDDDYVETGYTFYFEHLFYFWH